MINSFTAIDFKTANINPWSICQIGFVHVVNGLACEQLSILAQPPNNFYRENSFEITGITPEMTANAPRFNLIWHQIAPFIRNQDVVSRYAFLNFLCLKQTLEYYKIPVPQFTGHCTKKIFKESLTTLCRRYNITLNPRDVLSNANACAELFGLHLHSVQHSDQ